MSSARVLFVLPLLLFAGRLVAQAAPTLPSDTLQANYAPRSLPGPHPELAPTLPSDTLEVSDSTAGADSLRRKQDTTALGGATKDSEIPNGEVWGNSPGGRGTRARGSAELPEVSDPRFWARVSAKRS